MLCLALLICACGKSQSLEQTESKYVTVNGIKVHYKVAGNGKQSIVFVHGFGCDMNAWREQLGYFHDKAKMIVIDLPGYGKSDKPHTEYTLDLFADAVKAVMDMENASDAVLVGHSLGTPVCRQVTLKYPTLTSKLVDVDGVYCFYPADSAMTAAYHSFAESFNTDSVKQTIAGFIESLCVPQTPTEVKQYAMSVMPKTPRYIAYSTMKNLIQEKYWTNKTINISTLVIASKNSQIPSDYKQTMNKLYPSMEYHELDSIGHFIMMEQSVMFNKMLDRFINK
jgi:pimeloyl-ACP methyl ester carboxylesterase